VALTTTPLRIVGHAIGWIGTCSAPPGSRSFLTHPIATVPPAMARCRTFRYLLQPTTRQVAALELLLRRQCELYNAALADRRGAWRWERRSVSYFDQCRTLTELRSVRPEILDCGVTVCRGTLKRLDRAFLRLLQTCRIRPDPWIPEVQVRPAVRLRAVGGHGWLAPRLGQSSSASMRDRRCEGTAPPSNRGTPKAITVAREGRRWFVSIRCVDVPAEPLPRTGRDVGIDLGVCALVATSDGDLITEGHFGRKAAQKLAET
jgi:putative transposase